MPKLSRPLKHALLSVVLVPVFALLPAGASGAPTQGFAASAGSSGVRLLYKTTQDATGTQLDISGPVSSARVTSDPDSAGFASAPYPGDDLISLANTLGPALGLPAQAYPAAVSSSVPGRPQQSTSLPAGYSLTSTSTATSSRAVATVGAGRAGGASLGTSSATSDARTTATGVAAVATSATESFTAGPLVLSRVRSTASAVLDASGRTTLTSTIELGDATVADQRVGVTRHGLTVAGTDVPLPAGDLTEALSAAGVTVTYVAETRTATSVIAPGLLVHYKDDTHDTTYTLGRAQAAAAPATGSSSSEPVAPVIDPGTGSAAPPGELPGGVTSPVLGGDLPSGGVEAAPPVLSGGQAQPPAPQSLAGVAAAGRTPQTFDSGVFYLVLVLAAAAAMAVAQSMRYLGVRWASS